MSYLYTRFAKQMLSLSYRVTNNLSDSEDIVQEAFIHSFKKIKQLKHADKYASWLKQIVVNKSIRFNQSNNKHTFVPINEELIEHETMDENWFTAINAKVLNENIQSLPDGCREILTLFVLENYKHAEISDYLGISVSTSKSQYRYAIKLLRKKLKRYV